MNYLKQTPCICVMIDTNCINAKQKISELNRLECYAKNGQIGLRITEITLQEIEPYYPGFRKACTSIFTSTCNLTPDEQRQLNEISNILFPFVVEKNQNQENDVEIVFNCLKYGAMLVTTDGGSKSQPGGILGNKDKLKRIGIIVMNPTDAVQYIQSKLSENDL